MKNPLLRENQSVIRLGLLLLLLFAVARTYYGIWNAPVSLGDESQYIGRSFELLQEGEISSNLYLDTYVFVFRYITADPITAHYVIRWLASLLATVGLFLLLSCLRAVNLLGAFTMALLWNLNLHNTPIIQYGNINLFAFALACFAGVMCFTFSGSMSRWLFLTMLVVVTLIRPEYSLLLILWGFRETLKWVVHGPMPARKYQVIRAGIVVGCMFVLVGSIWVLGPARERAIQGFSSVDNYLFLGLNQSYAEFMTRGNPNADFDPGTEYAIVMEKRFPGAKGFFDALLINPGEMLRYFLLNGLSNVSKLHYLVQQHSTLLPTNLHVAETTRGYFLLRIERWIILAWIVLGDAWLAWMSTRTFPGRWWRQPWEDDQLFFVVGLGAVSTPALLWMHPESRYWIVLIPLLFWGPAAIVSKFSNPLSNKSVLGIAIAAVFIFANPVFSSSLNLDSNHQKEYILSFRAKLFELDKDRIKILGWWPDPLCTYAVPGRCESTNIWDIPEGSSYQSLIESRTYDLVLIDGGLRGTRRYKLENAFFKSFIRHPENFGYQLFLASEDMDSLLFRRIE